MPVPIPQADPDLVGVEIACGATLIGHIKGVQRDPLSGRIRRLVTCYGPAARRVAVPMEWVVQSSPTRVTLGVGPQLLDDLADQN